MHSPHGPTWPLTVYVQAESGRVTLDPHPCERHLFRPVQVSITAALQASENPMDAPNWLRWRVGRKVGRTIYVMRGDAPSDDDSLIGVMDTPRLAEEAVNAHNVVLAKVQRV